MSPTFFRLGVGVGDDDRPALPLAECRAGRAPGAAPLVGVAGLVEDLPDRRGRDLGQAVGGRPERLAKGRERPCRRAIGLRGGVTPGLAEDSLACPMIIESWLPAAMAW